jgi:hypothetical protein
MATKSEIELFFEIFLRDVQVSSESELEVRFGTKGKRGVGHAFLKNDYDNVVRRLMSSGFSIHADQSLLRISNEYTDTNTGKTRVSNVRTELTGMSNIQGYCRTNKLPEDLHAAGVVFNQKSGFKSGDSFVKPLEFDDFNFRIALQTERVIHSTHPIIKGLVKDWTEQKKTFRYINRVSFTHPDLPFRVDMSMVKSSKNWTPAYKIGEAEVFAQPVTYEMEIEMRNDMVRSGMTNNGPYSTGTKTYGVLRKGIQIVLAGLQGTNFPVSYKEHGHTMVHYMRMIHGGEWGKDRGRGVDTSDAAAQIRTNDFIGPSSVTLQMKNIVPESENSKAVNVRSQYTVTEKADGDRKMLFVAPGRKVYLITTAMVPEFTGMMVQSNEWENTLLDGEHIALNKRGEFINLFAAFDIYFCKGRDVRGNHFIDLENPPSSKNNMFRHPTLEKFMRECSYKSVLVDKTTLPMRVEKKTFYGSATNPIFAGCAEVMGRIKNDMYEYETDGLIFTPANLDVGLDSPTSTRTPANHKVTWQRSFKWKPPEFNTIDFLVEFEKDETGGAKKRWAKATGDAIKSYQTMRLRVGYDPHKHGYNNPCGDIMDDKLPSYADAENGGGRDAGGKDAGGKDAGGKDAGGNNNHDTSRQYLPALFFPTSPYDDMAHVSNRTIPNSIEDTDHIFAENNDVIGDNTVVEFRYDVGATSGWRWIPIRVRHDKTEDYHKCIRKFGKDYSRRGWKFGNDYSVANNNWQSIHNPVTESMISTGGGIPDASEDADTYYDTGGGSRNRRHQSQTRGLRDFHNLYVKRMLISAAAEPGDQMVDYAVGKGGDLPKWIHGKLSFVYGMDIAPDNIDNKMDGCCARYLDARKKYHKVPDCLFVQADSGKLIGTGDAFGSDRGRLTTEALLGKGKKDSSLLGKGVYRMYGRAADGFDVGSIQFALHYMCKDKETFHNFLRNVSDTVKLGGRFIATCYDGSSIISRLRGVEKGEGVSLSRNGRKIWEVVRQYEDDTFDVTDQCLGKAIDVFQESINKVFCEYLVHPDYLKEQMAHYGFDLTEETDVAGKGPAENIHGTGTFESLYKTMLNENAQYGSSARRNYGTAARMSVEETQISFLNRYYVFKKNRQVDAKKVYGTMMGVGGVGDGHGKDVKE